MFLVPRVRNVRIKGVRKSNGYSFLLLLYGYACFNLSEAWKMTILTALQFVTDTVAHFVSSSLFGTIVMAVGCFVLLIALIRVVWFIVRID